VRLEDCGAKLGLNGVDNGRIWFDSVRVPREALLDRYAQVSEDGTYFSPIENPAKRFFSMLATLIQGRVSVSGAGISASKVALTIAVRRALERRQFGPPGEPEALLMDYRTHQRRLLPAIARTYALAFAQQRLVTELDEAFAGDDEPARRRLETFAAAQKAVSTWHASETIQSCREACGGAGYLRSSRFAALKADTDVFTTFEGDNTVLLQLAAKNLLTDYKDQVSDLDPLGLAQFVAGQALGLLAERTPLRKLTDGGDLLSRETQLDLFRWRHEHLLESAARRLKRGIDSERDPFSVLVDCQDHVLEAARSWIDLVILEAFPTDEAVAPLRNLYALHTIEAERAYYLEHGRISGSRSKAIIKAVNELCAELRPDVRALVDAFGVPEAALGDARAVSADRVTA
jgi:acyl-CoA oxidase